MRYKKTGPRTTSSWTCFRFYTINGNPLFCQYLLGDNTKNQQVTKTNRINDIRLVYADDIG